MKKAFKLLAFFFLYSIAGLLIGTLLYSLYQNLLNYVAGNKFVFFDMEIFRNSFFYIAGCLILFISSVVAYSRIRYKGGLTQLFVFIIISFVSWGIALPVVINFGNKAIENTVVTDGDLSKGYFREVKNQVYYFLDKKSEGSGNNSYIQIDKSQNGKVSIKSVEEQNELPLKNAAKPYKDVLIADTVKTDNYFSGFINFRLILQKASSNWTRGWSFWLGFLSLGFVLCSIYGLSNFFNWKLINACLVMISTLLVLGFNTAFYSGWLNGFKNLGLWKIDIIQKFGFIVDEPVLVIINLFAGLCFIITGIIRFFVYRKKLRKGGTN